MTTVSSMMHRNETFASEHSIMGESMPALPTALPDARAIVIGCADMRVDPAYILGARLGEAVTIRNIGGRVTPALIEELGLLGQIGMVAQAIPGGGGEFNIIVLHHTDCGMTRLSGEPAMLAQYFGITQADLPSKFTSDPYASVEVDVEALKLISALPDDWLLSGIVYDVSTGHAKIVVPPAPIRTRNKSLD